MKRTICTLVFLAMAGPICSAAPYLAPVSAGFGTAQMLRIALFAPWL